LALLFIIIGLSNKEADITTQSNWVLQTNLSAYLNGRTINDMTFIDSLTGFAVTSNKLSGDTGYIFKTTNGGNNWLVNFIPYKSFSRIKFVNDSIGFACGGSGGGTAYFCKTTDRGNTWTGFNHGASYYEGMSVLNKDTLFLCDPDGLTGGIFRSVNGGLNFTNINSWRANNIYMYNSTTGFISSSYGLGKTTNGGFNWTLINNKGFRDIHFFDSLTGFRVSIDSSGYNSIQKTLDGGNNWIIQLTPNLPGITTLKDIIKISFTGRDTIWAVGNYIWYPNPYRYYGIICKTTNGGLNWGYQLPDTHSVQISRYDIVCFYGTKHGWAYDGFLNNTIGKGVHTTLGGDSTIYTSIKNEITSISYDYVLFQNFPNPFNPVTSIKYSILSIVNRRSSIVRLVVYNILGKEVTTLVNQKQKAGEYEAKFDGAGLPSGIYYYALYADGVRVDAKKMALIK